MSTDRNPFPDEAAHLIQMNEKLEEALKKAEENVRKLDQEYRDAKKYMVDYRGEIDPHEMFQNELLLRQTDRTGAFSAEVQNQLAKLKESPYFARIDFCRTGKTESSKFYIGRFTFKYENELLILTGGLRFPACFMTMKWDRLPTMRHPGGWKGC